MEKTNIKIVAENCTECLCCQLACSFQYTGAFNPQKARIVVVPATGQSHQRKISFTEECVKGCSLCAAKCPQGAIVRVKAKKGIE